MDDTVTDWTCVNIPVAIQVYKFKMSDTGWTYVNRPLMGKCSRA